jgi:hypothetical protein
MGKIEVIVDDVLFYGGPLDRQSMKLFDTTWNFSVEVNDSGESSVYGKPQLYNVERINVNYRRENFLYLTPAEEHVKVSVMVCEDTDWQVVEDEINAILGLCNMFARNMV